MCVCSIESAHKLADNQFNCENCCAQKTDLKIN